MLAKPSSITHIFLLSGEDDDDSHRLESNSERDDRVHLVAGAALYIDRGGHSGRGGLQGGAGVLVGQLLLQLFHPSLQLHLQHQQLSVPQVDWLLGGKNSAQNSDHMKQNNMQNQHMENHMQNSDHMEKNHMQNSSHGEKTCKIHHMDKNHMQNSDHMEKNHMQNSDCIK